MTGSAIEIGPGDFGSFSPSGRRVAFAGDGRRGGVPVADLDLFVRDLESGAVRRVTSFADGGVSHSSWSPGGSSVMFSRVVGGQAALYVADLGSGSVRRLTRGPAGAQDEHPAWSPDGGLVAFDRSGASDRPGVYVVRPDGTGLRRLAAGHSPDWAPDAQRLLFLPPDGSADLRSVRRDGSAQRPLLRLQGAPSALAAVWSPDGQRVAVLQPAHVDPTICDCARLRIYEPATDRSWWATPELSEDTQRDLDWAPRR